MKKPHAQRIKERTVEDDNGCLVWQGSVVKGYGMMRRDGRMQLVHRVAWELERDTIPDGQYVDHLCFNRACSNVDHLRLTTRVGNAQNRAGANANSSSGVRNVFPHPSGRYQVLVHFAGKNHSGGYHDTIQDAADAAAALRSRLHAPIPELPDHA